jgi:hypothetical protein
MGCCLSWLRRRSQKGGVSPENGPHSCPVSPGSPEDIFEPRGVNADKKVVGQESEVGSAAPSPEPKRDDSPKA